MNNMLALLDLYLEFEMFEEALALYNKISKEQVIDPKKVFLPYAGFLMRNNHFEEALEKYKQIGQLDLCLEMIGQFIQINLETKNTYLVAKFLHENLKLTDETGDLFPLRCSFFVFLYFYEFFSEKITFN